MTDDKTTTGGKSMKLATIGLASVLVSACSYLPNEEGSCKGTRGECREIVQAERFCNSAGLNPEHPNWANCMMRFNETNARANVGKAAIVNQQNQMMMQNGLLMMQMGQPGR